MNTPGSLTTQTESSKGMCFAPVRERCTAAGRGLLSLGRALDTHPGPWTSRRFPTTIPGAGKNGSPRVQCVCSCPNNAIYAALLLSF